MERAELAVMIDGLKMNKALPYMARPALAQALKDILSSVSAEQMPKPST